MPLALMRGIAEGPPLREAQGAPLRGRAEGLPVPREPEGSPMPGATEAFPVRDEAQGPPVRATEALPVRSEAEGQPVRDEAGGLSVNDKAEGLPLPAKAEGPPGRPVLSLSLDGVALGGRPVLGPVALSVAPGETVVLTGPSGIGKTTLLRIVAGLQGGFDGRIDRPARIAMVFQEPTLLPWRSLHDNLRVTAGIALPQAEAALAEVGLGGRGELFPGQLSLGQQRRLSLARAFAADPDLLLMDEPFVSLDPALVDEMMLLFARLRAARDVATILVTHAAREAEALGSRIVALGGAPARIVSDRPNVAALPIPAAAGAPP